MKTGDTAVTNDMQKSMHSLSAMAGTVGKLCEDLLVSSQTSGSQLGNVWQPATDVFECDKVYVIKMAISGLVREEDGKVQGAEVLVDDNVIVIRGKRLDTCPHEKRAYYQMEIHYGAFERTVRIEAPFEREKIRAEYHDGFLEVIIPKAASASKGTQHIEVTT